jgi:phosphatidate cytidylyltransferase
MHSTRLITALVAIPILIFLIVQGGMVFAVFLAAVATITLWEYFRIVFHRGDRSPFEIVACIGYLMGAAMVIGAHFGGIAAACGILAANLIVTGVASLFLFHKDRSVFDAIACQAMGMTYVPLLISAIVMIRDGADGIAWLFFMLFLVFVGDTGAYYAGKNLGRHKLWPSVSPKKTVEGALGGLGASIIVGALYRTFFLSHLPWGGCLALFVCVGVVAPLGDLFESVLKRGGDIKDSGNILPGHGGLLDRIDALLFAAPIVYAFKTYVF